MLLIRMESRDFLYILQARFDGKNPKCVADALQLAQKRVNEDHGGREVLTDIDMFNLTRVLIGAGMYICCHGNYLYYYLYRD